MVKKTLVMISCFFVAISILVSSDILSTQFIYTELDNISTSVGYYISKNGGITDTLSLYVKKEYDAKVYCGMDDCSSVKYGDTYVYILEKSYTPIVISRNNNAIKIERSVVIGLYS